MEIFGYNLETIFVWGKYFHFARRPLFCSRNVNWLKPGETLTSTDSSSSSPPDFTLGLSGQPPFNSFWRLTKCKVRNLSEIVDTGAILFAVSNTFLFFSPDQIFSFFQKTSSSPNFHHFEMIPPCLMRKTNSIL